MIRVRPVALLATAIMLAITALPVAAADTDGDGLRDGFERRYGLTSPDRADTDGDGVIDSAEDHDGDRLSDRGEQRFKSDPTLLDTDSDGLPDSAEDADGDGRSNALQQDQRRVPRKVRPALRVADEDLQPRRRRCQAWHGRSRVRTCGFGPQDAEVRVVLAGDSHATMYLTPLARIAQANGWQLTTMTKSACPALPGLFGNNQWDIDRGRSCRRWQERVIKRLAADPPDLVLYVHTPGYKLRRPGGRSVATWKQQGEWRRGLMRATESLSSETIVLALGGTPRNFGRNPVSCLQQNLRDISACTSRRQPEEKRTMDVGLQQAARGSRAIFASLYDQVCSYDPCPLIQGNVVMWRDGSHLSETFARRLQPSLEQILLDALAAAPAES